MMSSSRMLQGIIALLVVFGWGCAENGPAEWRPTPPSPMAQAFVVEEGLPLLRYSHQIMEVSGVKFFRATYGHAQDCPSGCFCSNAYGIRAPGGIGWLGSNDYDRYELTATRYYNFLTTDEILFHFETWVKMISAAEVACWRIFLPALAKNQDVPIQALLTFAGLLHSYPGCWVAENIIENPVVQEDAQILQILADLPEMGCSQYAMVRERARALLERLPGE